MKDLLELYYKLHVKTKEQNEVIKNKDYEELLKILSKKDKIIKEIDSQDIKRYLQNQENPKRTLAEIKQAMEKTKELDEENARLIKQSYHKLKKELKDINLKEKSSKGYHNKTFYEAKFIDKKG